ncbi:MAG TPA: nucleotidyltransferase family protein [Pseudacidobacterium sp.]|jgi:dTDP-glucose pyrophosphorylase/CBS domain-containing protein|nr:nucleotidyltransferase family protein [Pseudacidobacterium sp.]
METNSSRTLPLVTSASTVRDVLKVIDTTGLGIALVVDGMQRLKATITDGDVRRAILFGIELDSTTNDLLLMGKTSAHDQAPVTALLGSTVEQILQLMSERGVRQIPIIDSESKVVDIALKSDYLTDRNLPLDGFIMAGGFGKRLMPLTENCPKPMLPVNGKPILEHLVDKLRTAGIRHVHISTHYLADSITQHFRDGKDFGVDIEYVGEDRPMGTAGALAKVVVGQVPLLVVNGDIVTSIDFRAMLEFHREHAADMTVAVRQHEIQIPYGVVATQGVNAIRIDEKPIVHYFINAGIYLVQPTVCNMVPPDHAFDMPELITSLISAGKRVICFPVREYWLDVGQLEQYERASQDLAHGMA